MCHLFDVHVTFPFKAVQRFCWLVWACGIIRSPASPRCIALKANIYQVWPIYGNLLECVWMLVTCLHSTQMDLTAIGIKNFGLAPVELGLWYTLHWLVLHSCMYMMMITIHQGRRRQTLPGTYIIKYSVHIFGVGDTIPFNALINHSNIKLRYLVVISILG